MDVMAVTPALASASLAFGVGPIEPQRERLDVAPLDRRTAPDAEAPAGAFAIGVDVVCDAFFLERRGDAF